MALFADTLTIAFAAAANYTMPTQPDTLVAIKNIGANNVWISHVQSVVAGIEADECEIIAPNSTVYVMQRPIISMIAATADTKVNVVNAQGRM